MQGSRADDAWGLMRQRAREAFAQKIRRGEGRWEVPGGVVRTEDHRLAKIADRQGQPALDGVLKKLRDLGSARQPMLWSRDAPLPWPEGHPGTAGHDLRWPLPSGHRRHQRLTKPCSAGALVSGRTETKTGIEDGRARQRPRRQKPLEQWRIVLLDGRRPACRAGRDGGRPGGPPARGSPGGVHGARACRDGP
jgi:hypothetical protein